jgi:predicted O-methyltransferase YrrM
VTYPDFSRTNDPYTTAAGETVTRVVSEVCFTAAIASSHAPTLYFLIRQFGSLNGLELGTNLGIGACYQAAALAENGGRLTTLEGAVPLAERAAASLRHLGLNNVEVVCGVFAETLPRVVNRLSTIDYAYVDGHHQEEPTVRYLSLIRPKLSDGAIVVFDDITWSDGMRRAWQRIKSSPRVSFTVEMRRFGIIIMGAGPVRHLRCPNC